MKRTLATIGLGAGLMYLLDPEHGEERRAQLREKFQGLLPKTSGAVSEKVEAIGMKAIDLTSRADDKAAEAIATTVPPQAESSQTESSQAESSQAGISQADGDRPAA